MYCIKIEYQVDFLVLIKYTLVTYLFLIDVIADCLRKFSGSKSSSSSKPVLDIPPVRVPEHLDKPVVHDVLGGVEGHGRFLCAVERDESRAWVSLKLDLCYKINKVSTTLPVMLLYYTCTF